MSELVVVGYSDRDRAATVLDALRNLAPGWTDANDIVAVVRDRRGNLRMAGQGKIITGRPMPWSTLWRGLLQSTERPEDGHAEPVVRQASAVGLPVRFVRGVGQMVERGNSALIMWARTSMPPNVHAYLYASAGDVQWAPLSSAQNALLVSVLDVLGPVEKERI